MLVILADTQNYGLSRNFIIYAQNRQAFLLSHQKVLVVLMFLLRYS